MNRSTAENGVSHDGNQHGPHDPTHEHGHPGGLRGLLRGFFMPHSHDAADSVDRALRDSRKGMRALVISLGGLGVTAALQVVVVLISGSVALLADTVHNFADALTAVPLAIAFWLGRRKPTKRYTYGYGRAEDLAGIFIVAMIALSAAVAAWEAVQRLLDPKDVRNVGWVIAAGLVGFAGNELVALYRIRVGRESALPRSSPMACTLAPTASPRWQSWSARWAWPSGGSSPILSSASPSLWPSCSCSSRPVATSIGVSWTASTPSWSTR